jgi:hypothetical protein
MLRIRVTANQKRIFEKAARDAGLDVSGWIRMLSLREVKRTEVGAAPPLGTAFCGVTSSDLKRLEPITDPAFRAAVRAGIDKVFCVRPRRVHRR